LHLPRFVAYTLFVSDSSRQMQMAIMVQMVIFPYSSYLFYYLFIFVARCSK